MHRREPLVGLFPLVEYFDRCRLDGSHVTAAAVFAEVAKPAVLADAGAAAILADPTHPPVLADAFAAALFAGAALPAVRAGHDLLAPRALTAFRRGARPRRDKFGGEINGRDKVKGTNQRTDENLVDADTKQVHGTWFGGDSLF